MTFEGYNKRELDKGRVMYFRTFDLQDSSDVALETFIVEPDGSFKHIINTFGNEKTIVGTDINTYKA